MGYMEPAERAATAACTLPTDEQPLRVAEFDELFASCLTGTSRISARRLPLALSGPAELVERVQDLTDRESECCSFFSFSLSVDDAGGDVPGATHVILDIAVPVARVDVLDALTARAEAVTDSRDLSR
jgi:hypothetical protein